MPDSLLNRIVKFLGVSILRIFDTLVGIFAINKPILNERDYSFCKTLHENHKVILQEYNNTLEGKLHSIKDFYKTETDLNYDENWKAIPIVLFGYLFKENALKYPNTCALIYSLPGCCGAMFSILAPGKYIPPHKGIYKGVYRCLFTLQVAKDGESWIYIDGKKVTFIEGELIIFDETFEHEVMNDTAFPRIVLYLDLYRKLPFPLSVMNNLLFFLLQRSSFVKTILKEYQKLENSSIEVFRPAIPTMQ